MLREAGLVELLDDHGINVRRRGQIKQPVPVELVRAVEFFQPLLQLLKRFGMMIFAGNIGEGLREFLALNIATRAGIRELLYGIDRRLLEGLVGHRRACKSDDGEPPRQAILRRQAIQRRESVSAAKDRRKRRR